VAVRCSFRLCKGCRVQEQIKWLGRRCIGVVLILLQKHGRAFIRTCDGLEEGRGDLVKNPGGEEGEHEDAAVGDLGGAAAIWAEWRSIWRCSRRQAPRGPHGGFGTGSGERGDLVVTRERGGDTGVVFRPREMWTAGRDQKEISFLWGIESRALLSFHVTYSAWILYALRVLWFIHSACHDSCATDNMRYTSFLSPKIPAAHG
jgi:hypothetical protein